MVRMPGHKGEAGESPALSRNCMGSFSLSQVDRLFCFLTTPRGLGERTAGQR